MDIDFKISFYNTSILFIHESNINGLLKIHEKNK